MEKEISVLMSVYKNDVPKYLKEALDSIVNQTHKAKEIIIVIDGPISEELSAVLNEYALNYPEIKLHKLEKNMGLGIAMNEGTKLCNCDYIARMDSDDISELNRFEKQIEAFNNDETLSVVGSNSREFVDGKKDEGYLKVVPEKHKDICEFMKSRCPICHPSLMIKKEMLLSSGGYKDWFYAEDWYLCIRMYLNGAKFYNVQENLLNVRLNEDTYIRRSGLKYYKSIKKLLKYMKDNKIIGFFKYTKEKIKRFIGHVLIPKKLKNKLYRKFMRKKQNAGEH